MKMESLSLAEMMEQWSSGIGHQGTISRALCHSHNQVLLQLKMQFLLSLSIVVVAGLSQVNVTKP